MLFASQTINWNTGCWLVAFLWYTILWLLAQIDEQDTCSVSIYGKVSLQFLKQVLSIFPIFYLSLLKIITFLKIILRYHSEPDWYLKAFKSLVFMSVGSVTWNHNTFSGSVRWTNNFPTNTQVPGPEEFMNWTEALGPMPQNELNRMEANPIR